MHHPPTTKESKQLDSPSASLEILVAGYKQPIVSLVAINLALVIVFERQCQERGVSQIVAVTIYGKRNGSSFMGHRSSAKLPQYDQRIDFGRILRPGEDCP